jgi:uncharacterized OB-fold protein
MMRRLDAWRCGRGHVFLHPHPACPECGERLAATRVSAAARLLLATTVRVNPTGLPYVLGLAETECGRARTLCRVEGPVRGGGHDAVRLERRGATVVARTRRPR